VGRFSNRRSALACAALAAVLVPVVVVVVAQGQGVPVAPGDLLAAVGDGRIKHFDSSGRLVDILDSGQPGEGGAVLLDRRGLIYGANFTSNTISRFDATGGHLGPFGGEFDMHPEGITRDHLGNIYVGLNDGSHGLLKLDAGGTVVARYLPDVENRGIDWMDLDADQCTLLYTSEGRLIKRFDVCADEQLEDFATLPIEGDNRSDPTTSAYALRIRHNGEVVVATAGQVLRLSPAGAVVQAYTLPRTGQLLTLNLDADLTSFWTGDHATGEVFKVDIPSGQTLLTVETTPDPAEVLGGFTVVGEFLRADPRLHLASTGPVVVGQEATVIATLLNSVEPEGREIDFRVRGANPQDATVTTDASGTAVFRYLAASPGTDEVVAQGSSGRPLASLESNPISVSTTVAPDTSLVYSGATSGVTGQPATLAARLTDAATNQPLPGALLRFGLPDGEQCEATTDATGLGACRVVLRAGPGTQTVTAAFEGAPTAGPSSTTATLAVNGQAVPLVPAALSYTGPASGLQGEPVTLSARLVASPTGQPIVGAPVSFAINQVDTCGARTDVNGVATCQARLTSALGNQPVTISSEGDAIHGPGTASAQLLVVRPSGPIQGGRGVVLSLTSRLLTIPTIADTGEVATEQTTNAAVNALSFPGPVLTGSVAESRITTTPGAVDVQASLASLTLDLVPPLTSGLSIMLRGVVANARSTCSEGSSGDSRVGFLAVGPLVLVANEIAVPPNTTLTVPDLGGLLPRISVTLNEQKVVNSRGGNNLTVNALHLVIDGVADIVVSSARSDVHGCAPASRPVS